jgi:hypothetical protein
MQRNNCFDDSDYSFRRREEQGISPESMEVGNLSSREIEPNRAIALFSHYGGGQQSRESGAEAIVEQAQCLAIALRSAFACVVF